MNRAAEALAVGLVLGLLAGLLIGQSFARGATTPPAPEPSWLPVLPETPQPRGGGGASFSEPVVVQVDPSATVAVSPVPAPVVTAVPSVVATGRPTPKPGGTWSRAVASWYGADFYNRRTACGQTYTAVLWGVAHKSLPCGRLVDISFGGRFAYRVPVIDRGPYIAGRVWDLSNAVAGALGFRATGVGTVRWRYSG